MSDSGNSPILADTFVHLHVHTQYSLLDGAIRLDALMDRARQYDMKAVAITDHGTMFGTLDFYQKAQKAGIHPIIGCECYVAPRTIHDKTPEDRQGVSHLVLLAENMEGYRNLCRLASIAQLEGFFWKPRIDKALLRRYHQGLIALSACLHGEVPMRISQGKMAEADQAAREHLEIFGEGNYFLEVQCNGIPIQDRVNEALADMSRRLSIPLVATNDCHYLDAADVKAHEVLLCIQTNKTIHDPDRFKFSTDQLYFKSGREMADFASPYPGALENTWAIANRCQVQFEFGVFHFPRYDTGENLSADEIFEQVVRKGFSRVMGIIRTRNPEVDAARYAERLEYEIKVIKEMGFPGYFLIVADFIRYARENGVPVGPGRGSAAGSLVAYAMGITNLDPIAHGLIFERFLNPARKSMPDIDVDFCINGREKVFKYVVERYGGGDYVSQIITFGKMKSRGVIRDVGRALAIPLKDVDVIAKMVPDVLNITLDEALKQEPKILERAKTDPQIAELLTVCRTLEGLNRHASTHAAGVVISDKPLVEYLPLYRGKKGEVITQFDMTCVEKIGLVKFDFLGLRNLTVIDHALWLIKKQGLTPPDLENLDMKDPATYRLLMEADTTGVFQLESTGMKSLLARMRPECFDDIIALVALYRPGPLDSGMADEYVERKHGRKQVVYLVPELAPILESTYGVIVYQEQVMQIAVEVADYTMAEADDLRKAMGKKIPEIIAKHKERFIGGAVKKKIPEAKARELFELIEKFGRYGFNKSHSAAYALISFQTAYLKAHFQVPFLAALLTSEVQSSDGVVKFIAECRDHGIEVLPPDINESYQTFTVLKDRIRFGLVAVKNVGEAATDAIIEIRKSGRYASLFDFCERVELGRVNKRVVESLIKCGAFDSFGEPRARLMAALDDAFDHGQMVQRRKADPQMSLFDTVKTGAKKLNEPKLPNVAEWDEKEKLGYEKEMLGFYITGHPLDRYQALMDKFSDTDIIHVNETPDGMPIRIGGMIKEMKTIRSKNGPMAFLTIENRSGAIECVVFSKLYTEVGDLLVADTPVFVQGKLQKDEKGHKIIADRIVHFEEAENRWTATLYINLDLSQVTPNALTELSDALRAHPGACRGVLRLHHPNRSRILMELPDELRVQVDPDLQKRIRSILGRNAWETVCAPASEAVAAAPTRSRSFS